MSNRTVDPVKDIIALEEALINMDKKLDATRKYLESDEFVTRVARKYQELYPQAEATLQEITPVKG